MTRTKTWIQGLIGFLAGIALYTWATDGDLSIMTVAAFTGAYLVIWFGIQWVQGSGDRKDRSQDGKAG